MYFYFIIFNYISFVAALRIYQGFDSEAHTQAVLQGTKPAPKKVAIIGAGIAGASFAFELKQHFGLGIPFELVVYDQASQIGGLVNSTYLDGGQYTDYVGFVETGGSVFREDDVCIQGFIDEIGLRGTVFEMPGPRSIYHGLRDATTGVWDHNRLIFERIRDPKPRSKLDFVMDIWRYGLSVRKLDRMVQEKLLLFRNLATQGITFNLQDAVKWAGLENESQLAADKYLLAAGISPTYLDEIVEPIVRQFFGRNLQDMNALSVLVALDTAPMYRINSHPQGTVELIDRLLRLSRVNVKLNARVTSIKRSLDGLYTLGFYNDAHDKYYKKRQTFDAIVITSPLRDLEFEIQDFKYDEILPAAPANCTHIAYFTTPRAVHLSPQLFGLDDSDRIPNIIYTTKREDGILSIEQSEVWNGSSYDSISENLFKITSLTNISDNVIADLLGCSRGTPLSRMGVQWVHRQAWPGFLIDKIRGPPVDLLRILPRFYYTNGVSGLLPTMEMSCRLGAQAARGVYSEFASDA